MARKLEDAERPERSGQSAGSSADNTSLLGRREYLQYGLAAAAAVGTASGLSRRTSGATTREGISFDNVVNAVDDLGMDASGSTPIDSALSDALADDTLIEFPPGDYLLTDEHNADGLENIGLVGTGSEPSDVRFVFPDGNSGAPDPGNYVMLYARDGAGVLLKNFEIHQTADMRTGASILAYATDALEIHDVHWQGFNPESSYAKGTCLYPSIQSESGVGHITGVEITGGGVVESYPDRRMGILVQGAPRGSVNRGTHRGELIIRDCDLRELGSSAIRASKPVGATKIENCYFENNDNGSIRFGGGNHPSKRSWAKNCRVVVDDSLVEHLPDGESYENVDGCRIDANGNGWDDALVESCEFVFRSLPRGANSRGAVARPTWGDHAGFTVRDCEIQVDCDGVPPVNVDHTGSDAQGDEAVNFLNTHITGTQTSNWLDSALTLKSSDGSTVEDCCISLPEGEDGVYIADSANCAVEYTDIDVPGQATVFENSDVSTVEITAEGNCRSPGEDDGSTEPDLPHRLGITGRGTATNYEFTASGEVGSDPDADDLESWDEISGSTANGWVTETTDHDTFRFSGGLSAFDFLEGEAAITLNGRSTDPDLLARSLEIVAPEGERVEYQFAVEGVVAPAGSGSLAADDADTVEYADGTATVSGVTEDGAGDTWSVSGPFADFEASGDPTLRLDGASVTQGDLGGTDSDDSRTITITGTGESTNYEFTVTGDLAGADDSLESWDEISGGTVNGWVTETSHVDSLEFTGDIIAFEFLEGKADVTIDGQTVDPSSLGYDRELTIVGYDADVTANYEATVDGTIVGNPNKGVVSEDDSPAGASVEGSVVDQVHSYLFEGELTYFDLVGAAGVYLDGRQVDPTALANGAVRTFDNELTFDGSATAGECRYEFVVSGRVERSPDLGSAETEDTISSGTVTGSVTEDIDGFRFTGSLESLDLDGTASLEFGPTEADT